MPSLEGDPEHPATRRLPDWRDPFGLLILLGFGLGAATVFLGVLNHDVAWYLHAAGRELAGDRLYVDLIETNPPLIVWLSLVPQFLARSAGVSAILALRLLMFGLVAASLLTTRSALLRVLPDRPGACRVVLLLSLLILLPLPGYDFAQREHLLLTLFLPSLVMASGRAKGSHLAGALPWVVGIMAGVGLSLKPHFILPWIAIEAYLGVRRGWRIWIRPEALAVVVVGLTYAVALATITPEYLQLIRWAGPLYSASGRAPFAQLASEPGVALAILALIGFLALRSKGDEPELLDLILVADLGFLGIALLQDKGYSYHFYPPLALAVMLIGLLAAGSLEALDRGSRLIVVTMRGALITLLLLVAAVRVQESMLWRGRPGKSDTSLGRMIRVVEAQGQGGKIFTFSTAVAAGFPVVTYGGGGWASCHPALWFLPAFNSWDRGANLVVAYHPLTAMGENERFLFDSVVARLLTDQPTLLFVDETGTPLAFEGRAFDYLGYYAQDPRFVAFLREYEPFTRVDQFRVYRRKSRLAR
jgi:hypothetical protein